MTPDVDMQFEVSDKVVHPKHGAGQIVDVEQLDLMAGFTYYYVITFNGQGLTVRVPVRKAGEIGVRPIMSDAKLATVLNTLRSLPAELPDDYKARQSQIRERMRSGKPLQLAEAVRDLFWHRELAYLTKVDSELMSKAREVLAQEMAYATNSEVAEINARIDAALEGAKARAVEELPA